MELAAKLQLGPGQSLAIVNAPGNATLELADHPIADRPDDADALLVYATNRAELEGQLDALVPHAARDELTWIAYPKAGQLGTDLNRDVLAEFVQTHEVRPVRQVALDDVWSALRIRPS
jgi:hypothetical protein